MSAEQKSLKQIINFRKEKLNDLRKNGVNPYPSNFTPTYCSESIKINFEKLEGEDVVIAGRIMAVRRMGKASFFRIIDNEGSIQVFIKKDDIGDKSYGNFKLFDIGDFVGVSGQVFKTKTGEISIRTSELTLLAKSIRPLPIVKEKDGVKYDSFSDKEQRYRNRHLDLLLNPEVKNTFIKRTKIIQFVRTFLDEHKFLEVETPVLQPIYGGANARPFITHHNTLDQKLYMRIADELYLKRLIIGGLDRVYEIGKDFRNEGLSRFHNPEFTQVELYVAYKDYEWMMSFTEQMIEKVALELHGTTQVPVGEHRIEFKAPWPRIPMFDAILEHTGHDLKGKNLHELQAIAKELHIEIDGSFGVAKIIDEIFGTYVEPKLIQPTFITDYPIEMSPLTKKHRSKDGLVERFECICNGKEIANAYTELNDPVDQRERLEAQASLRAGGDDEAMTVDEDFLRALEYGMPPTAGIGIGIDRLSMIMTNSESIRDVLFFPQMKPE